MPYASGEQRILFLKFLAKLFRFQKRIISICVKPFFLVLASDVYLFVVRIFAEMSITERLSRIFINLELSAQSPTDLLLNFVVFFCFIKIYIYNFVRQHISVFSITVVILVVVVFETIQFDKIK